MKKFYLIYISTVKNKQKESHPKFSKWMRIISMASHENTIEHLFIVDVKFQNIDSKTLLFSELYPPIFEKNKKIQLFERSTLRLLSIMVRDEQKKRINLFQYNSKTHSTLKEKNVLVFMQKIYIFWSLEQDGSSLIYMNISRLNNRNLKRTLL